MDTKTDKKKIPEVSWEAPAFEYTEKTKDWYWVLWFIAIAMAAAAYVIENYSFMVLVLVAAFVLSLLASQRPPIIFVSLNKRYVRIGKKKYLVADYESYRLLPEEEKLLIKSSKPFAPLLVAPLGTHAPEGAIRTFIDSQDWIEDEELSEPFIEVLFQKLGF